MFDFATPVDRHGTWCTQWDYVADRFGAADLLPFTISDMDFATAPCTRRQPAAGPRRVRLQPLEKRGVSRGDCPLVRQPL
jgi:hypothetical protein